LPLPLLALFGALLIGCGGGGGDSQTFAACGNGRVDSGERCDDGNTSDADACTSACRPAACGDGVVEIGVEDCDGRALNNGTCAAVGRLGSPVCDAQCHYDYSVCGGPIPPTATITNTPPPTPTPTPPAQSVCGDALLNADEACDSCAQDCTPGSCPTGDAAVARVAIAVPPAMAKRLDLIVRYRTTTVTLPSGSLQSRLSAATGFVVRAGAASTNTGYEMPAAVLPQSQAGFLQSTEAFTLRFDRCSGAAPPRATDFDCIVTNCAPSLSDCTCAVALP
jgi:cysteine-rich repeat protein